MGKADNVAVLHNELVRPRSRRSDEVRRTLNTVRPHPVRDGTPGTIVFGSIYPWGSQLRLAALLRQRGYRVERLAASGDGFRERVRSGLERIVYHRVERSLGADYAPSSLRLDALERALDAGPIDIQLDDWLAAALTGRCADHPHFPHRTRPPFRELDLYDKVAMTTHAAETGWPTPQCFWHPDEVGPWPRIVKPRLGGGGEGIEVVEDESACAKAVARLGGWDQVIVQEFVRGESVRVGGIAKDGELVHAMTYRTVKSPADPYGPSVGVAVSEVPGLLDRARALLGPMGYTGIFGIESLQGPDGEPRFLEMNSRVLATMSALSTAGVDLTDDYLYAMGVLSAPSPGEVHETEPMKVDSIRRFGRSLGWRWVVAETLLRALTNLGKCLS